LPLLLFLLCTIATLTPTPLIEPRYFLTPFVILRILAAPTPPSAPAPKTKGEAPQARGVELASYVPALEAGWYVAVNAIALGVFLTIKFRWPAEEGWQRFMW
jgi:alpha-1,2-glucosyltransferase